MGSWNVSCGLSGLSISPGQEMVAVPLKASKYQLSIESPRSIISSDGVACGYFAPCGPPIRGKYNDYGALEDGTDVDCMACFHADVWDMLDRIPNIGSVGDEYVGYDTLELIGFEEKTSENVDGRNYKVYQYEDHIVKTTGFSGRTQDKVFYRMGELCAHFGIKSDKLSYPSKFAVVKKSIQSLFDNKDEDSAIARLIRSSSIDIHGLAIYDYVLSLSKMLDDEEIKDMARVVTMSLALFSIHKVWLPYVHGPQCGEREVEKFILTKCLNLSEKLSNDK